jgi:sodium/hydrogen exchanger 8
MQDSPPLDSVEWKIILILLLLIFTRFLSLEISKYHYTKFGLISKALSESCLCLLVGWIVGEVVTNHLLVRLSTRVFYLLLLPPIIFEGGYTLQYLPFLSHLTPILALALLGGIFSSMVAGGGLYWLGNKFGHVFELKECLIWGSLISSTDPITVLTLLSGHDSAGSTGSNTSILFILIFGESALNDAVAVIFYRYFTEMTNVTLEGILLTSVLSALLIFLMSVTIGLLTSIVACCLLKLLRPKTLPASANEGILHLYVLVICAYLSYLLGEVAHATGIISVFACGMGMGWWIGDGQTSPITPQLIAPMTGVAFKSVLRLLNTISESIIFLYLGMGLRAWRFETEYRWNLIGIAILVVVVSRCHVFMILSFPKFVNSVKMMWNRLTGREVTLQRTVPYKFQLVIFLAGLRGAVAFALCIELLSLNLPHGNVLFGTGVVVIAWTIVGIGALLPWIIHQLTDGVDFEMDLYERDWTRFDLVTRFFSSGSGPQVQPNFRDAVQTPRLSIPRTLSIQLRDPWIATPSPKDMKVEGTSSLDQLVIGKSSSLRSSMGSVARLTRVV